VCWQTTSLFLYGQLSDQKFKRRFFISVSQQIWVCVWKWTKYSNGPQSGTPAKWENPQSGTKKRVHQFCQTPSRDVKMGFLQVGLSEKWDKKRVHHLSRFVDRFCISCWHFLYILAFGSGKTIECNHAFSFNTFYIFKIMKILNLIWYTYIIYTYM